MFGAWTQLTSGTTAVLNAVDFPTGTQVGYVAGFGPDTTGMIAGQVLKTTDGGGTWTKTPLDSARNVMLNAVSFTDDNNGFAVGSGVPNGTIFHTTDGGATWTKSTWGTDPLTYVRFPSKGLIGYIGVSTRAIGQQMLKTTDGGSNWVSKTKGLGPLSWTTSCAFATDNQGVVVGHLGMVYGTTNGADTLIPQGPLTNADMVAAAFSPTDSNTGYVIGNDSNGGVVRYTTTFGQPLWDSVKCWPVSHLHAVTMASNQLAFIGGDSAGHAFIGVSAYPHDIQRTTVNVSSSINGLCFPHGEDTGFACGAGGTILRTYDAGSPWIPAVAEGKTPATLKCGVRVMSNPSRNCIALHADARMPVSVFDAAGRAVLREIANEGLNLLPVRKAGAYFVRSGEHTVRAVVTD